MMTVVIGGSGSGKSEYAETYIQGLGSEFQKYYLATMQVFGEEGRKKVLRHRELRKDKGFITIERTVSVENAISDMRDPEHACILLECMSNLAANEMFQADTMFTADVVTEKVMKSISILEEQCTHLIVVTNNIFEDGIQYDKSTMEYLRALGQINTELCKRADEVVEIVVGIPLVIKKGK